MQHTCYIYEKPISSIIVDYEFCEKPKLSVVEKIQCVFNLFKNKKKETRRLSRFLRISIKEKIKLLNLLDDNIIYVSPTYTFNCTSCNMLNIFDILKCYAKFEKYVLSQMSTLHTFVCDECNKCEQASAIYSEKIYDSYMSIHSIHTDYFIYSLYYSKFGFI